MPSFINQSETSLSVSFFFWKPVSVQFRRGLLEVILFAISNHPLLAGNVLYINLNVICAIQIISATLLVISISELKNIEPVPLVHMWKVAREFQTLSF